MLASLLISVLHALARVANRLFVTYDDELYSLDRWPSPLAERLAPVRFSRLYSPYSLADLSGKLRRVAYRLRVRQTAAWAFGRTGIDWPTYFAENAMYVRLALVGEVEPGRRPMVRYLDDIPF